MKNAQQYLIGGNALMQLGSTRHSHDIDYLVNLPGQPLFIRLEDENTDLINAAAGNAFFAAIWESEKSNTEAIATPATLLQLKAYAFVQHCLNGAWQKADDCEYDIKFIVRTFDTKDLSIVSQHVSAGQLKEVNKIIDSVK